MKKQSFLFAFLLIISFSAFAGTGIRFVENKKWTEILALAKSQHKPIFLDAYASWCGPCKRMKQDVFTQDMVGQLYNDKFVNVKIDMEEGEGIDLAKELNVEAYPTFFFINEKGEVLHKSVGALNAVAFVELARTALDPARQFYTLKRQAEQGRLTPAQFHAWLADAEQTDKDIIDSTVTRYLRAVTYPLLDADMLHIVLDYGNSPSRAQVDLLFAKRADVARILDLSPAEVERVLLRKLRNYALHLSVASDSIDFRRFQGVVQGYAPAAAWTETEKLRTNWYFASSDDDRGMASLIGLLQQRNSGLFAEDLADLILEHGARMAPHSRAGELLAAAKAFGVRGDDPKPFYRDVAILVLYLKQKDAAGIRTYAKTLYEDPAVPEGVRGQVKDLRDYQ